MLVLPFQHSSERKVSLTHFSKKQALLQLLKTCHTLRRVQVVWRHIEKQLDRERAVVYHAAAQLLVDS